MGIISTAADIAGKAWDTGAVGVKAGLVAPAGFILGKKVGEHLSIPKAKGREEEERVRKFSQSYARGGALGAALAGAATNGLAGAAVGSIAGGLAGGALGGYLGRKNKVVKEPDK